MNCEVVVELGQMERTVSDNCKAKSSLRALEPGMGPKQFITVMDPWLVLLPEKKFIVRHNSAVLMSHLCGLHLSLKSKMTARISKEIHGLRHLTKSSADIFTVSALWPRIERL
jgi:hypothetical protein